jgi:hypothetical protein
MVRAYLRQHHVGLVALLLVFLGGGSAYAAATIGAGNIKPNAVRSRHILNGTVSGADVNEASLDVSRVVNRARGSADQILTQTATNYPLTQGATWTQAANESVAQYIGSMAFDFDGCIGAEIRLALKIDDNIVVSTDVGPSNTSPHTLPLQPFDFDEDQLFEPGTPTPHTFSVDVSQDQPCATDGPIVLQDFAVNLIGIR